MAQDGALYFGNATASGNRRNGPNRQDEPTTATSTYNLPAAGEQEP